VKGCVAFNKESTADFVAFAETNGIKPVIAKEFAFEQAVEAFEAMQAQKEIGKIVIKVGDD
jgi:D-arabinose 1-dehydrogenase-like Zn-dependent alcohol dehydrogenase